MSSHGGVGFQAARCKTQLRMGSSRIKRLCKKKLDFVADTKGKVAGLLRTGEEHNARLQVEEIIMEQNFIEAYELLSDYAERISSQISAIDSQTTCPSDLKEGISTLLYASSKRTELVDFSQLRPMFVAKYGEDFVIAATDLRLGCGVNVKVVEKISGSPATEEAKLKLMKEIVAGYNMEGDPAPVNAVEPANMPRPGDDYQSSSSVIVPSTVSSSGPNQSRTEDLGVDDRHVNSDLGIKEEKFSRISRLESDIFPATSLQVRRQSEDLRSKSIGVSSEKSGRVHTGSSDRDMDESSLYDHKKIGWRVSQGADKDGFEQTSFRKGIHGKEYESGIGSGHRSDRIPGEDKGTTVAKTRSRQDELEHDESDYSTVPRRQGSGKAKLQPRNQGHEGDHYLKVPSREGSGSARFQSDSIRAGQSNKTHEKETSSGGDPYDRNNGREREEPYPRHYDSDEDADREPFGKPVTTRKPRSSEIRDFDNSSRRDSPNRKSGLASHDVHSAHSLEGHDGARKKKEHPVDDTSRKSKNLVDRNKDNASNLKEKDGWVNYRTSHARSHEYDSEKDEEEYHSRGGAARKPEPRPDKARKAHANAEYWSSDSEEESSGKGTRRFPRVDEQRRGPRHVNDPADVDATSKVTNITKPMPGYDDSQRAGKAPTVQSFSGGRRHGRGKDLVKPSKPSKFDKGAVDFDDSYHTTSSTGKRVSLPGGNVHEKPKYPANRPSNEHEGTGRPSGRRVPDELPAEEIRAWNGEGHQSSKYSSSRDRSDRQPMSDGLASDDDDESPRRLSNLRVDDEYSRETPVQSDRSDRKPKPDRYVNSPHRNDERVPPTPTIRSNSAPAPAPASTPRLPKQRSENFPKAPKGTTDDQSQAKPTFMKPPDLDDLIQMFGKKGKK